MLVGSILPRSWCVNRHILNNLTKFVTTHPCEQFVEFSMSRAECNFLAQLNKCHCMSKLHITNC